MSLLDPEYVKITIIVEEGDVKRTITIPRSRNVVFDTSAIPASIDRKREYVFMDGTIDIDISLKADFDDEKHHYYTIETDTNV